LDLNLPGRDGRLELADIKGDPELEVVRKIGAFFLSVVRLPR
jgi:hypothetical protein